MLAKWQEHLTQRQIYLKSPFAINLKLTIAKSYTRVIKYQLKRYYY